MRRNGFQCERPVRYQPPQELNALVDPKQPRLIDALTRCIEIGGSSAENVIELLRCGQDSYAISDSQHSSRGQRMKVTLGVLPATDLPAIVLLIVSAATLLGRLDVAESQPAHGGMPMPSKTLFVAQLDSKQVVEGSSSPASATGSFLLDPAERTVRYELTFQGLTSGSPKSVALYNFGKGKNGKRIITLCDSAARPCPRAASGTLSGDLSRSEARSLDNTLIAEFDAARIYVEIIGGNGKPEIRGQLEPNGAMVQFSNYTVHLAPLPGTRSKGTGTAVYSETFLPNGKVSVFYAGTVADTSGPPVAAALGTRRTVADPAVRSFDASLPELKLKLSHNASTGGSFSGVFEIEGAAHTGHLNTPLVQTLEPEAGIVITTGRFPSGELFGPLVPVR
jgi:hypothetical protein